MTKLYVLAEHRGHISFTEPHKLQEAVEMMTVQSPQTGNLMALFFSRIDAEICRQYLNQQTWKGMRNKYDCRLVDDRAVQFMINGPIRYRSACVNGFITAPSKRLIISGDVYSLGRMTLHTDDEAWIRGEASKPDMSVLDSVQAHFKSIGAGDHLDECAVADQWDSAAVAKEAQIAIAQIGFHATGTETGFAVYSPARKKWRYLIES